MGTFGRALALGSLLGFGLWALAKESQADAPAASAPAPPTAPAPGAGSPPPRGPAPARSSHAVVAPATLEAERISGNKLIVPDDVEKVDLARSGKSKLVTTYKLCVDPKGVPSAVVMLKGSGLPGYDAKIQAEMRQWRYRPYTVNGQAMPVCTSVTFIYQQRNGSPPPNESARAAWFQGPQAIFSGRQVRSRAGVVLPVADATLAMAPVAPLGQLPDGTPLSTIRFLSLDQRYAVELLVTPDSLASVAQAPVALSDSARPANEVTSSSAPGCRLRRGAPVQVSQPQGEGSWWHVTTLAGASRVSRVSGWVWAAYIGKAFSGEEDPTPKGDWVALPKGTVLRDAPGGRPLPAAAGATLPVHALAIKRKDGHALVMVEEFSWRCLGWVPETGLAPGTAQAPPTLAIRTPRPQDRTQPRPLLAVPLSTRLLDAPKGATVGMVLEAHQAQVLAVQNGHSQLAIETALGVLHLWVARAP